MEKVRVSDHEIKLLFPEYPTGDAERDQYFATKTRDAKFIFSVCDDDDLYRRASEMYLKEHKPGMPSWINTHPSVREVFIVRAYREAHE
jgi:hypothetical protein